MRTKLSLTSTLTLSLLLVAWAYAQDANQNGLRDRFELPGTQPKTAAVPLPTYAIQSDLVTVENCAGCHQTGSLKTPFDAWAGTMMGNSARDPVFWAQLDVAEGDEIAHPTELRGARDMCLRCHVAKGWLEGRSSADPAIPPVVPPDPTTPPSNPAFLASLSQGLRGMRFTNGDLFGVQCEVCHRMVDLGGSVDAVDQLMHAGLNTNPDPLLRVPTTYGAGMYILDRKDLRRGPFSTAQIGWTGLFNPGPPVVSQFVSTVGDWNGLPGTLTHPVKQSSFHRDGNLCGTCHDVSNPGWPPTPGGVLAAKGNAQANFPIERTWTEWKHSRFATLGPDGNCQSCHMSGPLNAAASGGASGLTSPTNLDLHLNDLHVHDMTGGNVWIPRMVAEMVGRFQSTKAAVPPATFGSSLAERDAFLSANYAAVLRTLFPAGTFATATATEDPPATYFGGGAAYLATSLRADATLKRAAQLSATVVGGNRLDVRIWNMTGHKLPTGYPEGRRMWLNVKFKNVDPVSGNAQFVAESGRYDSATGELYNDFNLDGQPGAANPDTGHVTDLVRYTDPAGAALTIGRRTQVYEARARHDTLHTEFHFILNNERLSDNRVPPIGWIKANYQAALANQIIPSAYQPPLETQHPQMVYHDDVTGPPAGVVEPTYNFDKAPYPIPANCDVAELTLNYQSLSREYIKELQAASPRTLVYPVGSASNNFTRGDLIEHAWRTFSLAGQTGFPPTEMATLRVALVDADGDGLPDDWESFHGLSTTPVSGALGAQGRFGDPDGDGFSNYQEFQRGTSPAAINGVARAPLDLVLVLDFSGSMNDPAPAGNGTKVAVLKDAVDLFLRTWKQYAIAQDRLGVVYFESAVTTEGAGLIDFSALPPGVTIDARIDTLIASVRARNAAGWTAMGGGLQRGLNLLQGGASGRRKHVILFTNGMQNYSPMVRPHATVPGGYVLKADVGAADVNGDSGITDAGGPAFNTLLSTLNTPIHTIGIGVAETADDRWLNLIQGIGVHTSGMHQFVSRAFELEGAFLQGLVNSLRGFSPQMVADHVAHLSAPEDVRVLEFPLDVRASKATFILSWADEKLPGRLTFDLTTPGGKPAGDLGRMESGPNYLIGTYFLPMATLDGRPEGHAGTWRMSVRRDRQRQEVPWRGEADFRAYLIADFPEMDFVTHFRKRRVSVGEELILEAAVLSQGGPLRPLERVTATLAQPRRGLGTFLSLTPVATGKLDALLAATSDAPSDRAAAKTLALLGDAQLAAQVAPLRSEVDLHDDGLGGDAMAGDGLYTVNLGKALTPGLVTAQVSLTGPPSVNGTVNRRFSADAVVGLGAFSDTKSRLEVVKVRTANDGSWVVEVRVTPMDGEGNYLGPGYRDRVGIRIQDYPKVGDVQDRLDGSYVATFTLPLGAIQAHVEIKVEDSVLFDLPASSHLTDPTAGLVGRWLVFVLLLVILILVALLVVRSRKSTP
ncbi:MAG: VWA domain-containing protein [Planctomycetes bacterium]|nr:VWA domain-containing protein [Planctomycetota bacterium]